ncbi:MAG: hypothetical protein MUF23_16055 [Pirellula sp.]|jgi:hypothetical protein|nr:hypothetical protein [Pirellula sp.]
MSIRSCDGSTVLLAFAQWESSHDDQMKLQFLEQGLVAALKIWQQADLRIKAGLRTYGDETLARAAVFRLRHLWFKEKARLDAAKKGDTNRKDQHESK